MRFLRLALIVLLMSAAMLPASAQAYECGARTADEHITAGYDYYNNRDYQNALIAFNCALAVNPSDVQALYGRGDTYWRLGDYAAARADAEAALEIDINNPYIGYQLLGLIASDELKYDEALGYFEQSLEFSPGDPYAYNGIGNLYYAQGDYAAAIENYELGLQANDPAINDALRYNRGISRLELGDSEGGIADLETVIETYPDDLLTNLALGYAYAPVDPVRAADFYYNYTQINLLSSDRRIIGTTEPISYDMTLGRVYFLSFEATEGQIISISARGSALSDIDPLLVLLDPSNDVIAADDDSGINLDSVIADLTAPTTGEYTVILTHGGWGSEGQIRLAVSVDGSVAETFAVYQLLVGEDASVYTTGGDRLNLRSGPGLNFEIAERLESGTRVTLLEGPRKVDGYAWWKIRTADGLEGWAVERVDVEQTLQPVLEIGGQARINTTAGDKLNVRTDAGRSFELVTQLVPGVIVTVIEGPVAADNLTWWKIRTPDGLEGWAVERVDADHTLIGVPTLTDGE